MNYNVKNIFSVFACAFKDCITCRGGKKTKLNYYAQILFTPCRPAKLVKLHFLEKILMKFNV